MGFRGSEAEEVEMEGRQLLAALFQSKTQLAAGGVGGIGKMPEQGNSNAEKGGGLMHEMSKPTPNQIGMHGQRINRACIR